MRIRLDARRFLFPSFGFPLSVNLLFFFAHILPFFVCSRLIVDFVTIHFRLFGHLQSSVDPPRKEKKLSVPFLPSKWKNETRRPA